MNAIAPRFIARRRNHAPPIGLPAHHHWPAAQVRALEQFHRNEEGIHIHVENGRGAFGQWRGFVLRSEMGKFWHRSVAGNPGTLYRYRRQAETRTAAITRGMPARSLVTVTSIHPGWLASNERTWSDALYPSSSTRMPPGGRTAAACWIRRSYISVPVGPPNSAI